MTAYTTEQIVEAMAREIWYAQNNYPGAWADEEERKHWGGPARAALAKALEMMQEPTIKMLVAAELGTAHELIAALEAATGPSEELDKAIWLSQKTGAVEAKGVWQNGSQRFISYHTADSLENYHKCGSYDRQESEFMQHDELPRYTEQKARWCAMIQARREELK